MQEERKNGGKKYNLHERGREGKYGAKIYKQETK